MFFGRMPNIEALVTRKWGIPSQDDSGDLMPRGDIDFILVNNAADKHSLTRGQHKHTSTKL